MSSSSFERVAENVARRYDEGRRLLTFDELLDAFAENPYPLARNAAQYLSDAVTSFGTREVETIGGTATRYRVFDGQADDPAGLVGHEAAQAQIVNAISAAARQGRMNRMIVLHGPNGSGKSSLIELLLWGLEVYSHSDAGAAYSLRWMFPRTPAEGSTLGFGGGARPDDGESYALLEADDVAARIVCELRCNPLFVVPDSERPALLEAALGQSPEHRSASFRHFLGGNLCPRCKNVYEALLAAYRGDWRRLVQHVQVERVYISRRYRIGAVVTQPQGTADAQLRIVSTDAAAAGLPPHLRSIPLFEVLGDLADANRGLLEFSDFLKRNLELSKYLLQTTEKGFVTVGNRLFDVDIAFAATVNERHLDAFKQMPEFPSFQARMTFVRIPYLRNMRQEVQIYRAVCKELARSRHVAPHIADFCAIFAVLTRVQAPRKEAYETEVRTIVSDLTPLEKAWLYADGRTPDRLSADEARELRRLVPVLRDEFENNLCYEGRVGASVREIRSILSSAAVRNLECLTPSALVDEAREAIADPSRYRFLQVEAEGPYHDAEALLGDATRQLANWILSDVEDALELVHENEYDRRFDRYFVNLVAIVKGGPVRDPNTGELGPPDPTLLESVEKLLPVQEAVADYRADLVTRIGAYAVDHPDEQPPDFRKLFPDLLRLLRQSFFDERREVVTRAQRHLLLHGSPTFDDLPDADRVLADRAMANLTAESRPEGRRYCGRCAKNAVHFALVHLEDQRGDL